LIEDRFELSTILSGDRGQYAGKGILRAGLVYLFGYFVHQPGRQGRQGSSPNTRSLPIRLVMGSTDPFPQGEDLVDMNIHEAIIE
jgi:hypothetical protein